MTARSRLAKLEGSTAEPAVEDWLAILDAPDQAAAIADLEARFPLILTGRHLAINKVLPPEA